MIEQDTIKLLRECDAGVKMGIASINQVIEHTDSKEFADLLAKCRDEHLKLDGEIDELLNNYGDEGKDPNPIAKGMSWIKTNIMLDIKEKDSTIADLMTDGCNMGVKSLNRYLNQYEAAEEFSKDIAKRLINLEEELTVNIRKFL